MKYIKILSARKNPHLNKKHNVLDYIKSKYDISDKTLYVTFTEIEKIGVRPNSLDKTTPAGVYTFPLSYIFSKEFQIVSIDIVNRPNVFILKRTVSNNDVFTIPSSINLDKELEKLQKYLDLKQYELSDSLGDLVNEAKIDAKSDAAILYKVVNLLPDKIDRVNGKRSRLYRMAPMVMNNIFRKVFNFKVIEDNGTSTIHRREPTQTLFLTTEALKVVESINNYQKDISFNDIEELNHAFNFGDYGKKGERDYNIGLDYLRFSLNLKQLNPRVKFNFENDKASSESFFDNVRSQIGLTINKVPKSLSKEERRFRICFSSYYINKSENKMSRTIIDCASPEMKDNDLSTLKKVVKKLCFDFPVNLSNIDDKLINDEITQLNEKMRFWY